MISGQNKLWVNKILSPKKFQVQKTFKFDDFGSKKIWVHKILGQQKFWVQKLMSRKIFQKCLGQTQFLAKPIFDPNKIRP